MVRTVADVEASMEWARAIGDLELYEAFVKEKKVVEGRAMTLEIFEARVNANLKKLDEAWKKLEPVLALSNPQEEEKKAPPARPFSRFFHFLKGRTAAGPGLPTHSTLGGRHLASQVH